MNFLFLNLPGLKVGVFIDDDLQFKSFLKYQWKRRFLKI
jgi:hypothetical protein